MGNVLGLYALLENQMHDQRPVYHKIFKRGTIAHEYHIFFDGQTRNWMLSDSIGTDSGLAASAANKDAQYPHDATGWHEMKSNKVLAVRCSGTNAPLAA